MKKDVHWAVEGGGGGGQEVATTMPTCMICLFGRATVLGYRCGEVLTL